MKINGVSPNKIINLYNTTKKLDIKDTNKVQRDSIEISSLGKSLSYMSLDENYEISEKRLEEIRDEISKGTYNVDSKLVAQRMINFMKGREL
ncbi:MAG: flagellar biosynthesis anti-sigma factor FlgM [Epulopiscium sp.]|nr:flagellar biosynthesis anti-sigma factor FlgM [Candidatus Epulonipiscium sp.]